MTGTPDFRRVSKKGTNMARRYPDLPGMEMGYGTAVRLSALAVILAIAREFPAMPQPSRVFSSAIVTTSPNRAKAMA
ncbi:hypothetical protein KU6B_24120 [Mameliella alba]|nr:hypothetical protein KU6B_24120 [Mameliella alba]